MKNLSPSESDHFAAKIIVQTFFRSDLNREDVNKCFEIITNKVTADTKH
jgi:hypothetical protein